MLGTLMLVLFLCLFATVPIALSLGISTLGVLPRSSRVCRWPTIWRRR